MYTATRAAATVGGWLCGGRVVLFFVLCGNAFLNGIQTQLNHKEDVFFFFFFQIFLLIYITLNLFGTKI